MERLMTQQYSVRQGLELATVPLGEMQLWLTLAESRGWSPIESKAIGNPEWSVS
ncbi:MAG: hypothetical protein AAGA40_04275 [Cyanobacteria bacterium P01_E01_bin.45]